MERNDALRAAETGLGSLLWIVNNRHNWAHPEFDNLSEAAEKDAREALAAVRAALTAAGESQS